jgi:hypothetical protein
MWPRSENRERNKLTAGRNDHLIVLQLLQGELGFRDALLFKSICCKLDLNCLLFNKTSKTQLLFSSRAGNVTETLVEVDGSVIHPVDTIELLGVRYDRKLSTTLHIKALLADVRQCALVVARLANHLPRGE